MQHICTTNVYCLFFQKNNAMPINKNANLRYQVLDKCLSNTFKKFYIDDLLEAINEALREYNGQHSSINRRQLFGDLKYIESEKGYNLEIDRIQDGKKKYYRYKNPKSSIHNRPINEAEEHQLQAAVSVLQRFRGLPQFDWLNEIIPKINQNFGFDTTPDNIIQFEENPDINGLQWIELLFQYINNQQPIALEFMDFYDETSQTFILHPYQLKQYNKNWFLISFSAEKQRIWVSALDRIVGIEPTKDVSFVPNPVDLDDYFDDVIGVTRYKDEEVTKIRIKVYAASMYYVMKKPLHHSQRYIEKASDYIIIELRLLWNYEIEALILSYGDNMEVLSPLSFRKKIAARVAASNQRYME
jgi:hypothetical protein